MKKLRLVDCVIVVLLVAVLVGLGLVVNELRTLDDDMKYGFDNELTSRDLPSADDVANAVIAKLDGSDQESACFKALQDSLGHFPTYQEAVDHCYY